MLSVDASGVQPGTNTLPLTLNLGSGYTLVEDSVVTINVVDQSEKQQIPIRTVRVRKIIIKNTARRKNRVKNRRIRISGGVLSWLECLEQMV